MFPQIAVRMSLVIAFASVAVIASSADVVTADKVKQWANIRSFAGGPIVSSLPVGKAVEFIDELDGWYHVRMDQHMEGYVSKAKARRIELLARQAAHDSQAGPIRVAVTSLPSAPPAPPPPYTIHVLFQDLAWLATLLGLGGVAFGV
jgi:hypothetical protein